MGSKPMALPLCRETLMGDISGAVGTFSKKRLGSGDTFPLILRTHCGAPAVPIVGSTKIGRG